MVGFSIAGCRMISPGVEGHRQALARALRVPDDADAPVARLAAGLCARLVAARSLARNPARAVARRAASPPRHVDRVELVVAGHLLDELAAAQILEDDEVPDQVEEAALLEDAFEHHLQLGEVRRVHRLRRRSCARA